MAIHQSQSWADFYDIKSSAVLLLSQQLPIDKTSNYVS